VSAAGSQPPASGNGAPASLNDVDTTFLLWQRCRREIEEEYPWLREIGFFNNIEAMMCVLDVEEQARFISGDTWFVESPDDYFPIVTVYFTYVDGRIVLRAAHAAER
jgi:hypothetical protein